MQKKHYSSSPNFTAHVPTLNVSPLAQTTIAPVLTTAQRIKNGCASLQVCCQHFAGLPAHVLQQYNVGQKVQAGTVLFVGAGSSLAQLKGYLQKALSGLPATFAHGYIKPITNL